MRKFPRILAAMLAMVLCLAMLGQIAGAAAPPQEGLVDVLIGFRNGANPGLVRQHGGEVTLEFLTMPVVAARMHPRAAEALSRNPNVEYVELDGPVYAHAQTTPWGIDKVTAPEAWGLEVTGAGVSVAVLDTGINYLHEDLRGQVVGGTHFYGTSYMDDNGHGSHVAGTIAAVNNDIGVVGVAPNVSLYAVKVLDRRGSGTWSTVAGGIDWVVNENRNPDVNIQVINMSLGGSAGTITLATACENAFKSGVLLVASAGNSGSGTNTVGYPAQYPSVIAVAASDQNDLRASFSSTGPAVELIAPGVRVLSTTLKNTYSTYNGTSMASPHVAGVAALVFAAKPAQTNAEVRAVLTGTARDLGLPEEHQGHGLVQAGAAVAAVLGDGEPPPPPPPPPDEPEVPVLVAVSSTITMTKAPAGKFVDVEVTVTVTTVEEPTPVAGVAVTVRVTRDNRLWTLTGTTNSAGVAVMYVKKAAAGTYNATITSLTKDGYEWTGMENTALPVTL